MNDYSEESYRRYRQYRLNQYRYEQDQKLPIYIIIFLAFLSTIWHYILLALLAFLIVFFSIAVYKALRKKDFSVVQSIVLTKKEAEEGTSLDVHIANFDTPFTLNVIIPPKTKNGQKFALRDVKAKKSSGKTVKIDIFFIAEVK